VGQRDDRSRFRVSERLTEAPLTVLFTDVEGSTALHSARGDVEAQAVLVACDDLSRQKVEAHHGRTIKSLGDGLMAAFTSPRRAVACALAIQEAIARHGHEPLNRHVRLRAGLHTGEVSETVGDLFGNAVNAAARVCARAKGGEVLVSEVVRQLCGTVPGTVFEDRGRVVLKGFPERWRLYRVTSTAAPADFPNVETAQTPVTGPEADQVALNAVSGRTLEPRLRDLRVVLPAAVVSFTGREVELTQLAETAAGPVVVTQALAGLGGVGKTALALEYAHRRLYTEHAVDLVWWFTASDRLVLTLAMARLYEQLTGVPAGEDSALSAMRLRNWLENTPHRWLVVFDNADEAAVLADLVPRAGAGQVLITSRRPDWSALGATVHSLGVLPLNESVALLSRITGRHSDERAVLLAEELGGLAVALRQAGAFIAKTGWDYGRYMEMLRTRPLRLHSEDLAGVGTTMVQVWESSLEQLTRSGRYGSRAPDVLGVLAYFAAEDIPRQVLARPAIDGEAVLGGGDALEVELALVGLAEYSLITLESDAVTLHRLVQHLSRLHVEDQGTAVDHAGAAIRLLRAVVDDSGSTVERVTRLLPHVSASTTHAVGLSTAIDDVTYLLNAVALDRIDVGQLDVARSLLDRALSVATDHLGHDHPSTLTTRANLAHWLGEAGRADEAVAQFQALLDDERLGVLGPDHPSTLTARNNLAHWLGTAGHVEDAIEQFRIVLAERLRVLGPDHPSTLVTRNSLAGCLGEIGQVAEAVAQFRIVLAERLRLLGPDHPSTLTTRDNLAHWVGKGDQVAEAVAQFQALLEDRLRVLGRDHPSTLNSRANLAHWLGEAGRADEAVAQFQALLDDHLNTLTIRSNLAGWLGELGRADEAVTHFRALLDDRLRMLGPDHPSTLNTRASLAHCMGDTGKAEETRG
jgi:class 3 adenylate cyclase/tetratricopeptide (TPR) repeat protein